MDRGSNETPETRVSPYTICIRALQELPRHLPISFYLILAIIIMLLVGLKGFSDLHDPRKIALTLLIFMIFFAAVVYRALMDAIDIARKHYREEGTLMSDVFERDGFSKKLNERLSEHEKTTQHSTDTPPNPPTES